MNLSDIAGLRLHNQQLSQTQCRTPADVVGWLGAVQAQEYAHAKWALGLRLPRATDAMLDQAFAEGSILRLHVMRPTWHFVTPADIRWLLELTAPRVNAASAYMYRTLELDDALFGRSNAVMAEALQGGKQLPRKELGVELTRAGIASTGMRLGYLVMRAELDAVVCSGARRGNQFTYALLAERAPTARILPREEALAELTRRYFTSHGPATAHDFAWWSGLTLADVKIGLDLAKGHLIHDVVDGKSHWRAASTPEAIEVAPTPAALLLPVYDEYVIAYRDHHAIVDESHLPQARVSLFSGVVVIGGRAVGNWRRTLTKDTVVVESAPFRPFSAAEDEAFAAAALRYSEFLGLTLQLA